MKNKFLKISLFFLTALSVGVSQVRELNHPELDWETIETEHFLIHFHQGVRWTAHEVAKIAESIYKPVTQIYNHEPDGRVSFIIKGYDDKSNGAAYFYENRIEIWAPALDYELRGTHPWLWNVVTHEFTHIIQIQASMKFGRKIPGIYFQWLGYEADRRPDILYGFPNVLVSYPLPGIVIPSWFAEGTAQFNNPELDYDYWDSHRDMILRMYMLDGNALSWEEMAHFGKNSLGNESSYNAGFSIVEYIGYKYGAEKLLEISQSLSVPYRLTIDGAIESAIGKTAEQLYEEWKTEKTDKYRHAADSIKSALKEGNVIEEEGFGNFYPVFSPDGSKIAYISNKGNDYFYFSSLYLYDCEKKTSKEILSMVRSSLSFSPDGQSLYYSKITKNNPNWYALGDIYRYDIATEEEKRLTHGLRAFNSKLSSDGRKIVFAFGEDGTLNIGVCDADGKNIVQLTNFKNGEQVYTPVWSKNGERIAFGYSTGHNQSVALIDSSGANFQILPHTGDCRNPFFASDSILYYAWDRGGIYNLYSLNLLDGYEHQITNVLGGAFLPSLNDKGDITYATYTSSGYKIALLNQDSTSSSLWAGKSVFTNNMDLSNRQISLKESDSDDESLLASNVKIANESDITFKSRPYKFVFTGLSIFPLIRIDNYNESGSGLDIVKPGLYINSTDVLDKFNIFGGGAINRKFERDLFLIFEYGGRLPILYQLGLGPIASIELYNITRKRDVSFDLYVGLTPTTFNTDVTYNLFELDCSLLFGIASEDLTLKLNYQLSRYNQDIGNWLHPSWGVIKTPRSTYLIGNILSARIKYDGISRTIDREINPIGRTFTFKYSYEMNDFNPDDAAEYKNGFRVPVYTEYNYHRLEFLWSEHIPLPIEKHTLTLSLSTSGIIGKTVDDFFDDYAGGFIGMHGYSFYAIGGNSKAVLNATYRFPIMTEINLRLFQLYFKKLFGSVFYDIGNAWSGQVPPLPHWKRDIGFELRLETFSFYLFPTRIFFSGAYGLDKFERNVTDINIRTVTYGHEWRFYLGVLFGFELNDIVPRQFMR